MSSSTIQPSWLPLQVLITFTVFVLVTLTQITRRRRLPPGPPAIPIIGNLHLLGELPHRSLWNLSPKHGPLIYLKLGSVPTVIASSPETARELLKTHDTECCTRPAITGYGRFSYGYADVAFSQYSDYWREVRKICVLNVFSVRSVQSFRHIREEEVKYLVETISQHSVTGEQVNLSEMSLSYSASVFCRFGFGMSFQESEKAKKRFLELLEEANTVLGRYSMADYFPYFGWILDRLTGLHRRQEKCFHELDELYEEMIKNHMEDKNEEGREDIVNLLLKIEREHVGEGQKGRFTRNNIKAILMNMVTAGIGTSPRTLIWAMTELIRNPKVMKKAQSEIRKHIKNKGIVGEEDLEKLEYLKLVTKETLRLHPPGTLLLPREAISKFQVSGYDINPKTRIQVNVWAIGRDPSVWKDPLEFCPERFVDNPIDMKGQDFELLPFGGGRRVCPGIYMGMIVLELVLANLLHRFDWKLPEGMREDDVDMEEEAGLSIQKKFPLHLVPVKYT